MRVNAVACALQRPTSACVLRFIAKIKNLLRNIVIVCSGRDSIVRINAGACAPQHPARTCGIQVSAEIKDTLIHYYCSGRDSIVRMNAVA